MRKMSPIKKFLSLFGIVILALALSASFLDSFGGSSSGDRLARIKRAPNFNGNKFINTLSTPIANSYNFPKLAWAYVFGGEEREPRNAVTTIETDPNWFKPLSGDELSVTWLGHSTLILEIDGQRFITDPIFSDRCSPFTFMGPSRFFPLPIDSQRLPKMDGVIISHDHYDHLDEQSIRLLAKTDTIFYVPLGVGAHLEVWGVKPEAIVELGWWEQHPIAEKFNLINTPARHFSGRGILDRNKTLWSSWVIQGPNHNLYFSGDTGLSPHFQEIGDRYGPFDIAFLEVGAFNEFWSNVHLGPNNAAKAFKMLKADYLFPVHWATFNLALHSWDAPGNTLLQLKQQKEIDLLLPTPGQMITLENAPVASAWWKQKGDIEEDIQVGLLP